MSTAPLSPHVDLGAYLAGRIATAQRRAQLDRMDAQLAARRPRRDPWREMEAAERDREQTLAVGHRQRLDKAEARIAALEARGRHWWTPAQTDTYVQLIKDRDASKEWLAAYEHGNHLDDYRNL
jgi:hypothetical protein